MLNIASSGRRYFWFRPCKWITWFIWKVTAKRGVSNLLRNLWTTYTLHVHLKSNLGIYYVLAVVVVLLEREQNVYTVNRLSFPADVLFISEYFLLFCVCLCIQYTLVAWFPPLWITILLTNFLTIRLVTWHRDSFCCPVSCHHCLIPICVNNVSV